MLEQGSGCDKPAYNTDEQTDFSRVRVGRGGVAEATHNLCFILKPMFINLNVINITVSN